MPLSKPLLASIHREVNKISFNTAALPMQLARAAQQKTETSLKTARDNFVFDGPAVMRAYNGGFCTSQAQEVVRLVGEMGDQRVALRCTLLPVPNNDSLRPLGRAMPRYDGPVHVDVAISDGKSAAHIVCGVGDDPQHIRMFRDLDVLRAHLLAEGYAPDAVRAIGEHTATPEAFAKMYREQLGMRHTSHIVRNNAVLGVNLVKGVLSINSAALKEYSGPLVAVAVGQRGGATWPLRNDSTLLRVVDSASRKESFVPAGEVLRAVTSQLGQQFKQPADFSENMMRLAEIQEAFRRDILAPSASHAEAALTHLPHVGPSSWPRFADISAAQRRVVADLLDERKPQISGTFGRYFRDVLQVYATLSLEMPTAEELDTVALQAAVMVGRTGADVAAQLHNKEGSALEEALATLWKATPARDTLGAQLVDAPHDGGSAQAIDALQALLMDQVILGISRAGVANAPIVEAALRQQIDARITNADTRQVLHKLCAEIGQRDETWPSTVNTDREKLSHLDRTENYYWANVPVRRELRALPLAARALSTAGEVHWLHNNLEAVFTQLQAQTRSVDEMLGAFSNRICLPLSDRYAGVGLGEPMRALLTPLLARLGRVIRWQHEEPLKVVAADADKIDDLKPLVIFAEGIAREPRLRAAAAEHLGLPIDTTASGLLNAVPSERLATWLLSTHSFDILKPHGICIAAVLARVGSGTVAPLSDDSRCANQTMPALRAIDATLAMGGAPATKLASARSDILALLLHPAYAGGIDALPKAQAPLSLPDLRKLHGKVEDLAAQADARLAKQFALNDNDLAKLTEGRHSMARNLVGSFGPTQLTKLTLPDGVQASKLTVEEKREAVRVYEGVRCFVQDPLRVLRRLQDVEVEVMARSRSTQKPLETAFMDVLEEAEKKAGLAEPISVTSGLSGKPFHAMLREFHAFDDTIFFSQPHGSKSHRLQNLLVMREMDESPEAFGLSISNWGRFYGILGNRVLRHDLGYPQGEKQEDLWRMLFDMLHTSNFGCADAVKSIAKDHAPWLGDIEHTPLTLETAS